MDLPEWVTDYWVLWYLGFDAVLFLVASLLWNTGSKAVAALLVLLALCLPLAFLTVFLEPEPG